MMTGSIACYKACDLISQLMKNNFNVKVVASRSALNFVGPATFEGLTGEAVYSDAFEHGRMMSHIDLARWADLILLCPATANAINALANGSGEGMISDIFLSNNFLKKFWIAPAMNSQMLAHPATQESLKKLSQWGVYVFETESGDLACGEKGYGRLVAPTKIFEKIISTFKNSNERAQELSL
jgi:phosphopantothenoylcysteine synthetase/decarboxylase